MDAWQALRYAHIAAGAIAFLVAPIPLAARKGGPAHRTWGYVYLIGMTFATLSATVLAATTGNTFFTFVGLFSFYLGFSGFRAIGKRYRVSPIDWAVGLAFAGIMVGMIAYGAARMASVGASALPLVAFGIVGLAVVRRDLRHLVRPPDDPNAWFFGYMIGMVSSATAAMSAFSATNARFLPPAARILWPLCVAVPLLSLWARSYRRRLASGRPLSDLATVRMPGPRAVRVGSDSEPGAAPCRQGG